MGGHSPSAFRIPGVRRRASVSEGSSSLILILRPQLRAPVEWEGAGLSPHTPGLHCIPGHLGLPWATHLGDDPRPPAGGLP